MKDTAEGRNWTDDLFITSEKQQILHDHEVIRLRNRKEPGAEAQYSVFGEKNKAILDVPKRELGCWNLTWSDLTGPSGEHCARSLILQHLMPDHDYNSRQAARDLEHRENLSNWLEAMPEAEKKAADALR